MAAVCCWSTEGGGGGNEQDAIYFSQIHVYSLNDLIYNEHHDYPLVVIAECFVLCIKWQSYNLIRCID